ncbi:tyrosine-type recombinase/integrase [Butyrivibrio sp. XBB1001]|uniref:tyrosine-type recombinase/integrase n=1 Tax=Butyrivibrio sp. XBB1001 TaxID=1280682 RepID=UPI000417B6EC|nr:tyrosine-type recombinase/integrase [Butyrivibrio sp. XBB1001]
MATGINYFERTKKLLDEMPDYVSSFIYRYGGQNKNATMYEYCRDIHIFLEYVVNCLPECCDKQIKDVTIEDLGRITPEHIDNYIFLLRNTKDKRYKDTEASKVKAKEENKAIKKDEKLQASENTLRRKRATVSAFFTYLMNNGKIAKNPVFASQTVDVPQKKLIYLDFEQQQTLMNTVIYGEGLSDNELKYHSLYAERDAAMFMLMLDTGLRVSEMLGSNIVDYDLVKGKVTVIRKGGDEMDVYYSDECAGYLSDYFESQKAKYSFTSEVDLPAFTTNSGDRLSVRAVETLVKKYVKASLPSMAGKISPHKLRSSFAMTFYEANNYDILLLQKRLNHKSVNTTNIYAKATDKAVSESRNLLQEFRKNKIAKTQNE